MDRKLGRIVATLAAAVSLTGCSIFGGFTHSTADSAGNAAGDRVGSALGNAMVANYSPMMMNAYMGFVFSAAFSSGGYAVGDRDYQPGEYTRWNLENPEREQRDRATLERAYLGIDPSGNSWWKVKWVADTGKPDESTLVVEALFDKEQQKILRMRAKMPNEKEGKEMPVEDQTYYTPPRRLTKESVQGATVGTARITVPAGTFDTSKVVYGDAAGGSVEWYLAKDVPGGSVKIVHAGAGARGNSPTPHQYVMALAAYGAGAASELGTFKPASETVGTPATKPARKPARKPTRKSVK